LVTNLATAFIAGLLQITLMDYFLNKPKKYLQIHFLKKERDLRIRSRLLMFTAATIVYMLSFIALPAFNKLEEEKFFKEDVKTSLLSGMSKEEIFIRLENELNNDPTLEYTRYTILISLGLTLIIMGSGFIIFVEFNRRLNDIHDSLDELTKGEGDLSKRFAITKFDEVGLLMHNFNRLMQFLSELFSKVKKTIFEVKGATDELTSSLSNANLEIEKMMGETEAVHTTLQEQYAVSEKATQSLDTTLQSIESGRARISDQATVIEENSASITEITENIHQVHENTEHAMHITNDLETSSAKGSDAVNDTIEAVSDIAAFSKEVKEAGEIISTIASQTNVLAMNASIEAAHAGSFGRGFSVVAEEVRKLAELASMSAGEILATIRSMDEKIQRTVELAYFSGNTLERIFDGMKRSAGLVTEITHAMSEQSEGANEIQNSFMHLLSATEDLKKFIVTQSEMSDVIKKEMVKFVEHSLAITRSMENLLASDNNVKKEVGRVIRIAGQNNSLVSELFTHIMKFKVDGDGQKK
jgi:methyl-accepting chemotaxis protein